MTTRQDLVGLGSTVAWRREGRRRPSSKPRIIGRRTRNRRSVTLHLVSRGNDRKLLTRYQRRLDNWRSCRKWRSGLRRLVARSDISGLSVRISCGRNTTIRCSLLVAIVTRLFAKCLLKGHRFLLRCRRMGVCMMYVRTGWGNCRALVGCLAEEVDLGGYALAGARERIIHAGAFQQSANDLPQSSVHRHLWHTEGREAFCSRALEFLLNADRGHDAIQRCWLTDIKVHFPASRSNPKFVSRFLSGGRRGSDPLLHRRHRTCSIRCVLGEGDCSDQRENCR